MFTSSKGEWMLIGVAFIIILAAFSLATWKREIGEEFVFPDFETFASKLLVNASEDMRTGDMLLLHGLMYEYFKSRGMEYGALYYVLSNSSGNFSLLAFNGYFDNVSAEFYFNSTKIASFTMPPLAFNSTQFSYGSFPVKLTVNYSISQHEYVFTQIYQSKNIYGMHAKVIKGTEVKIIKAGGIEECG